MPLELFVPAINAKPSMKYNKPPLHECEHEGEGRNLQLLGYNVSAFDTHRDVRQEWSVTRDHYLKIPE